MTTLLQLGVYILFFIFSNKTDRMKVVGLRNLARERNIPGRSRARTRNELLRLLTGEKPTKKLTLSELTSKARERGLSGYICYRRRADLMKFLERTPRNRIDEKIPEKNVPILQPEIASTKPSEIKIKALLKPSR